MPRVADIYQRPAGIDAIPNQTIESVDYNVNVADVETDLNFPRPIVAGGTGATSATNARLNLDAERSMQEVVNYDTHIWEAGSFYSAPAATGSPVAGHWFVGEVVADPGIPTKLIIAFDVSVADPVPRYQRRFNGTTWSTWSAENDQFVNVAGDTMTGNLNIQKDAPAFSLIGTSATSPVVYGAKNNLNRWSLVLGSAAAETGGETGSHFAIQRHNDAGVSVDLPLVINRTNGETTLLKKLTVESGGITAIGGVTAVTSSATPTTGTYSFGNTGTKYLTFDGTNFILNGGGLVSVSPVFVASNTTDGVLAFGTGGAHYLQYTTAGKFVLNDSVSSSGSVCTGGATPGSAPGVSGSTGLGVEMLGYLAANRNGLPAGFFGNNSDGVVVYWNRSGVGVGSVSVTTTATAYNTSSDERLKEDLKSFDAGNVIDNTNVYDFAWKETGERSYGVLAQQAIDVYPTAVTHDVKEDWWGIDYSRYVPVILQELKTLRERVAALEAKVG